MYNAVGALPIISVVAIFLSRMVELGKKRATIPGPVKENLTFRLFVLIGALMLACGILEHIFLRHRQIVWTAFAAGWLCAIISFLLRRRAISALGQFWSLHVEIRENHQFVQSGPFRWMRHPTYFSMILELLSGGLILAAWFSLLIIPLFFLPVLAWRLCLEEKALVEKFGDSYRSYQKTTPALLPIKWPLTH